MRHKDCAEGTLHLDKYGNFQPCPTDVKRVTRGARWPKGGYPDWELQVNGLSGRGEDR